MKGDGRCMFRSISRSVLFTLASPHPALTRAVSDRPTAAAAGRSRTRRDGRCPRAWRRPTPTSCATQHTRRGRSRMGRWAGPQWKGGMGWCGSLPLHRFFQPRRRRRRARGAPSDAVAISTAGSARPRSMVPTGIRGDSAPLVEPRPLRTASSNVSKAQGGLVLRPPRRPPRRADKQTKCNMFW